MGCGAPAGNVSNVEITWLSPENEDALFGAPPVVVHATATVSGSDTLAEFVLVQPDPSTYGEIGTDQVAGLDEVRYEIPNTVPPDDGRYVTVVLRATSSGGESVTASRRFTRSPPSVTRVELSGDCIETPRTCASKINLEAEGALGFAPETFRFEIRRPDDASWVLDDAALSTEWQVDPARPGVVLASAELDTALADSTGRPVMPDGLYQLSAVLQDLSGEVAEFADSQTFAVDNSPPVLTQEMGAAYPFALDAYWVGGAYEVAGASPRKAQVDIAFTVQDANLARVRAFDDTQELSVIDSLGDCTDTCSGTLAVELAEGSHRLYLVAEDRFGHETSLVDEALVVNVDLTPPTVSDDSIGSTVTDASKLYLSCPSANIADCQLVPIDPADDGQVDLGTAVAADLASVPSFAKFEHRLSASTLQAAKTQNLPVFYLLLADPVAGGVTTPGPMLTATARTEWSADGSTWSDATSPRPLATLGTPTGTRTHAFYLSAETASLGFHRPGYYRVTVSVTDLAGNGGRAIYRVHLSEVLPAPVGLWIDPAFAGSSGADLQDLSLAAADWDEYVLGSGSARYFRFAHGKVFVPWTQCTDETGAKTPCSVQISLREANGVSDDGQRLAFLPTRPPIGPATEPIKVEFRWRRKGREIRSARHRESCVTTAMVDAGTCHVARGGTPVCASAGQSWTNFPGWYNYWYDVLEGDPYQDPNQTPNCRDRRVDPYPTAPGAETNWQSVLRDVEAELLGPAGLVPPDANGPAWALPTADAAGQSLALDLYLVTPSGGTASGFYPRSTFYDGSALHGLHLAADGNGRSDLNGTPTYWRWANRDSWDDYYEVRFQAGCDPMLDPNCPLVCAGPIGQCQSLNWEYLELVWMVFDVEVQGRSSGIPVVDPPMATNAFELDLVRVSGVTQTDLIPGTELWPIYIRDTIN
ncbi:MAG: hypothetical protein D6729_15060 [Deltaproteobacteria bacterium]|nr:MAG: hypothetical protein D6729_15060 [Deltaproteobacteria bacterium]